MTLVLLIQEKYVQRYETMKKQYKEEMEEFYSEHPDARPPPPKLKESTPRKPKKTTELVEDDSESTERINEVCKPCIA